MIFNVFAAAIGLAGVATASSLDQYPGEEFHKSLLRRQEPGTPAYACHDACGNAIRASRAACYCGDETFRELYSECLICAGPDNQNIWMYYGTSLTTAATACGLPTTPVSGSTSTQSYGVTTTILGTSGINSCATSSTLTSSSLISVSTSSADVISTSAPTSSTDVISTSTSGDASLPTSSAIDSSSVTSATETSSSTLTFPSSTALSGTRSTSSSTSISISSSKASEIFTSSTSRTAVASSTITASSGINSGSVSSGASSTASTIASTTNSGTSSASGPSSTAAFNLAVIIPTARRNKRQTTSVYIGSGGIITEDITKASQFSVINGGLYSSEGQFSSTGLTAYAAFAPITPLGSISTLFSATTTLTWSNTAFSNGVASYCLLGSVVQFVFTGTPSNCIPVSLAVTAIASNNTLTTSTTVPSANSGYTTSTVYTTNIYTITGCAQTVVNCPVGSITTEILSYVTICPVASVVPAPAAVIKTIQTTKYYTVTACAAIDKACSIGSITSTVGTYTTTVSIAPAGAGATTTISIAADSKPTSATTAVFTGSAPATMQSFGKFFSCAVLVSFVLLL